MWTEPRKRSIDEAIIRLAGVQHGVVARWQPTALQISGSAISWRLGHGRLHVVRPGVYCVTALPFDQSGALVAAILSLPPGTVASHRAAADMHRIHPWSGHPEVTTPRPAHRRSKLILHTALLPPDEVGFLRGIPVTKPSRTLFDLASVLDERALRRALNEAAYRGLALSPSLLELIERHPRRRGAAALRGILAEGRVGLERSESDFEHEFAEWLRARGFPPFVQQHPVAAGEDRYRLDVARPEVRVAAELDTPAGHDHPEAIERDKRRDRRLRAIGWAILRVTARAFALEREEVEADLQAALAAA